MTERAWPSGPTAKRDLGWWTISGESFLEALRRCANGEDPDVVYAEFYANSTIERP